MSLRPCPLWSCCPHTDDPHHCRAYCHPATPNLDSIHDAFRDCPTPVERAPYSRLGCNPIWNDPRYALHQDSFVRTRDTTPIRGVLNRLGSVGDSRLPVVLLATGTFYPVHSGHILSLLAAKKHLETFCDCSVVGAFVSPCHRWYLEHKHRRDERRHHPLIGDDDRLHLIALTIRGLGVEDWVFLDRAEPMYQGPASSSSDRDKFVSHRVSMASMKDYLESHEEIGDRVRVLFVCGWDHWVNCRKMDENRLDTENYGIVVSARESGSTGRILLQTPPNGHLHFVPIQEETEDLQRLSSTQIRDLLWNGRIGEISHEMMCPEALALIAERRLFVQAGVPLLRHSPIRSLFSPEDRVLDRATSVFLAGCTPSSGRMLDGWRHVVLARLRADPRLCHHMTVVIPEPECGSWGGRDFEIRKLRVPGFRQLIWEERNYEQCSIMAFWMPMYWTDARAGPSFDANIGPTTRWEFGEAVGRFKYHVEDPPFQLVVGAPRDSQKMSWPIRKVENLGLTWHWLPSRKKYQIVSAEFIEAIVAALLKNKNCECCAHPGTTSHEEE